MVVDYQLGGEGEGGFDADADDYTPPQTCGEAAGCGRAVTWFLRELFFLILGVFAVAACGGGHGGLALSQPHSQTAAGIHFPVSALVTHLLDSETFLPGSSRAGRRSIFSSRENTPLPHRRNDPPLTNIRPPKAAKL